MSCAQVNAVCAEFFSDADLLVTYTFRTPLQVSVPLLNFIPVHRAASLMSADILHYPTCMHDRSKLWRSANVFISKYLLLSHCPFFEIFQRASRAKFAVHVTSPYWKFIPARLRHVVIIFFLRNWNFRLFINQFSQISDVWLQYKILLSLLIKLPKILMFLRQMLDWKCIHLILKKMTFNKNILHWLYSTPKKT